MDASSESLPTLFELPDLTPEAIERRHKASRFVIHDAHSGPPASHVDPPSGSQSHLSPSGPSSPFDAPTTPSSPARNDTHTNEEFTNRPTNEEILSWIDPSEPEPEEKIAAFNGSSLERQSYWSKDGRATWITRSAIAMSVLVMVTLAFFSGRGLQPGGDDSPVIVDGMDLDDPIIVITEDVATETPMQSAPSANDSIMVAQDQSLTEDVPSYIANAPMSVDEPVQSDAGLTGEVELEDGLLAMSETSQEDNSLTETTDSGPSVNPTNGALGQPRETFASSDEALLAELAAQVTQESPAAGITPPLPSADAVVAFRAESSSQADEEQAVESVDDLPPGLDGRLRLEDGLRYSDTPYPIGNFLEILKAWEAAAQ